MPSEHETLPAPAPEEPCTCGDSGCPECENLAAARASGGGILGARKPRGFATMSPSKRSEIASKGGKAAHASGRAHTFTSDEARAAGRKGGLARRVQR